MTASIFKFINDNVYELKINVHQAKTLKFHDDEKQKIAFDDDLFFKVYHPDILGKTFLGSDNRLFLPRQIYSWFCSLGQHIELSSSNLSKIVIFTTYKIEDVKLLLAWYFTSEAVCQKREVWESINRLSVAECCTRSFDSQGDYLTETEQKEAEENCKYKKNHVLCTSKVFFYPLSSEDPAFLVPEFFDKVINNKQMPPFFTEMTIPFCYNKHTIPDCHALYDQLYLKKKEGKIESKNFMTYLEDLFHTCVTYQKAVKEFFLKRKIDDLQDTQEIISVWIVY